jgi:hypothetical protein
MFLDFLQRDGLLDWRRWNQGVRPFTSAVGSEVIADTILEAVLSDSPKAVYSVGPLVDEILGQRIRLDDDAFNQFLAEKTGLKDLKV